MPKPRKGETIQVETIDLEKMPTKPDPLWPAGVPPTHLPPALQDEPEVVKVFEAVTGPIWRCEKCGTLVDRSSRDARFCKQCADTEIQNTAVSRKMNANWMDESKELGLQLFERQPEETDQEWLIWTTYRSYYPLKMPTWTELAKKCGVSVATVTRAAQKWSYKVRLVAWARFTDETIQEDRIVAIKEMNQKQLAMAQNIQQKLATAIEALDPTLLKPNEIVSLFKVATELERRVTTYVDEKVESTAVDSRTKQISTTRPEDLGEIVAILQKTGVLEGRIVGVEQTTRLLAKEDR